jgi:hypothetical protein
LLLGILIHNVFTVSENAIESDLSDYERYYPKYIDSKEPLSTIESKDFNEVNKVRIDSLQSTHFLRKTLPYGSFDIQQLDIYRLLGESLNPVIFFIHAGSGDKDDVRYALPAWLSLPKTLSWLDGVDLELRFS